MRFAILVTALAGIAAPAAAAEPAQPAAKVEAGSVIHAGEGVTVRVPESAAYAGGERFTLYGVADAEVHLFVEANARRRLRRLWWIQFESYLPSKPELSYDYADGNRPIELGGVRTWLRSNPVPTTAPVREGSDREAVFRILKRAGIGIPEEVMNVRLVQLLDDPAGTGKGRRELMIIYSEDLAPTGRTLAELTDDGKPNAAWAPMEKALIERATGSVTVERD
jgi:hypothetical protein